MKKIVCLFALLPFLVLSCEKEETIEERTPVHVTISFADAADRIYVNSEPQILKLKLPEGTKKTDIKSLEASIEKNLMELYHYPPMNGK